VTWIALALYALGFAGVAMELDDGGWTDQYGYAWGRPTALGLLACATWPLGVLWALAFDRERD